MRAEQQAYQGLTASSAVVALVGTAIYPDEAPEAVVLPCIVFSRSSTEPIDTIHDGTPVASKVTLTLSIWAETNLAAEQLGDAAVVALAQIVHLVDRFAHFDEQTNYRAAVLTIEIWEFGSTSIASTYYPADYGPADYVQ